MLLPRFPADPGEVQAVDPPRQRALSILVWRTVPTRVAGVCCVSVDLNGLAKILLLPLASGSAQSWGLHEMQQCRHLLTTFRRGQGDGTNELAMSVYPCVALFPSLSLIFFLSNFFSSFRLSWHCFSLAWNSQWHSEQVFSAALLCHVCFGHSHTQPEKQRGVGPACLVDFVSHLFFVGLMSVVGHLGNQGVMSLLRNTAS